MPWEILRPFLKHSVISGLFNHNERLGAGISFTDFRIQRELNPGSPVQHTTV